MSDLVIVLYGPPASGKDTVTTALHRLDSEYVHFQRLKAGRGRQDGYRITTVRELDRLASTDQLIWENEAYGARYAIDRRGLTAAARDRTPVVHVGQPEAVEALREQWAGSTVTVSLWCDRTTAIERLHARDANSIAERLAVWDLTPQLVDADVRIDTGATTPDNAAATIAARASAAACLEAGGP